MEDLDKEQIRNMLEEEGFEYTFLEYDTYEDLGDQDFNKLVKNYIKAVEKIKDFLDMEY